jgi:hypothetical protein
MRLTAIALMMLLALCGCNSQSAYQAPDQLSAAKPVTYQDVLKRCNDMLDDGKFIKKNAVPFHQCVIDVKGSSYGYADDLDRISDLKRLELARELAKGKITADEFNLKIAEYEAGLESMRIERLNQTVLADSARRQAAAAERGAAAAASNAVRNALPVTTNCNTYGKSVSCTTY